jgi:putative flavoprotein involved in K+ transport
MQDAIVIGAGQAGLAAGYHLQRAGKRFTILESGPQAGGSWPYYYESLRLFSPARFSSLPGLPFPGDPERYPARDEVIDYLRAYTAYFRLPIETQAHVSTIERTEDSFTVLTEDGRTFQARTLIAATGSFQRPFLPQLPGQEQYQGTIMHSMDYRTPASFANQRVIVVGAGNSAVQIAAELARHAQVTLASRAPVRFVTQRPLGRDVHFWWWLLKLDTSPFAHPIGALFRRLVGHAGPRVLDTGVYRAALAAQKPDQQTLFSRLTTDGVIWEDGRAEQVDAVIFATGYRPNLGYLASLGALDQHGQALHRDGLSTSVPGLGFVGLSDQRTMASATLRGVGADAAVVVQTLLKIREERPVARLHQRIVSLCCPGY